MRIILNPKYKHLQEYLEHIDEHFEHEGHEIHRDRNVIRLLQVDGLTLCVKRFGKISLPARVATKFRVRTSRARKAYVRPLQLKERGFESPEPVAFIRYSTGLISSVSYFVSLKSKYRYSMADIMNFEPEERDNIIKAFAEYAANLHTNGFLHRDFSASNILFDRIESKISNRIHFSLIDTNSMRCNRSVSVKKGCSNFARLVGDENFFRHLGECYATARNANSDDCIRFILTAHDNYVKRTTQK